MREITLELDGGKGWRRLGGGREGRSRIWLHGSEVTFEHAAVMLAPLTVPAGLIAVATADRGRSSKDDDHGRFAILRRLGPNKILPREEGVEGWLWTSSQGSAVPVLSDRDEAPNVALVFVKPLGADVVTQHFEPSFVRALADRSPLGAPTVFGLLARVEDPMVAELAFKQLVGVEEVLTDREIPPALRRHLPTDKAANPTIRFSEAQRAGTSVPPPGMDQG